MLELEEGEYIIGYLRKHWILFVLDIIWIILLALLPFVVFFIPKGMYPEVFTTNNLIFIWAIWTLGVLVRGFMLWTLYYLDMWVVTNRRLIDQEQISFFSRKVSTLELEHIQDITITTDGVIETFIGFGTLSVETAGEYENFEIHEIRSPENAKRLILDAQNEIRKHRAEMVAQAYASHS